MSVSQDNSPSTRRASKKVTEEACADLFGGPDPADTHPDQEPRTRWRRANRPAQDPVPRPEPEAAYEPLTAKVLAAEEKGRLQGLGKAKGAPPEAQAQAPVVQVPWEERAGEACAVQEKRVRAAAKVVREAQASLRKAERAYYQEGPSSDENGQEGLFDEEVGLNPDATKERDLRALLAAQESYRHARDHLSQVEQAAPLAILREVTAAWRPPAWAWALLGLGAVACAGNLVLLGVVVFVGLPVFAFIGALRL